MKLAFIVQPICVRRWFAKRALAGIQNAELETNEGPLIYRKTGNLGACQLSSGAEPGERGAISRQQGRRCARDLTSDRLVGRRAQAVVDGHSAKVVLLALPQRPVGWRLVLTPSRDGCRQHPTRLAGDSPNPCHRIARRLSDTVDHDHRGVLDGLRAIGARAPRVFGRLGLLVANEPSLGAGGSCRCGHRRQGMLPDRPMRYNKGRRAHQHQATGCPESERPKFRFWRIKTL